MDPEELETRFSSHPATPEQVEKYEALRVKAKEMARLMVELCPVSRESSLAFTHLEESLFWANAAIARRTENKDG